jgi:cell division septation protein DedD
MPEGQKEKHSGLSVQTLLISAAAAAVAATVVPLIWERGTIFATAMTPVIVALVSEGLRKPVQHVSAVAPRVARRSGTGAAVRRYEPAAADTPHPERVGARGDGPERFDPLPPHLRDDAPEVRDDDPYGLRKADRRGPRLKIALVTGLLAFFIAAGVVTATELTLFGGSVSGKQRTSLFGGSKKRSTAKKDEQATPTTTPIATETPAGEDATPTPSPTATATPTPAVNLSPSPQPTATPGAATPAPTP